MSLKVVPALEVIRKLPRENEVCSSIIYTIMVLKSGLQEHFCTGTSKKDSFALESLAGKNWS